MSRYIDAFKLKKRLHEIYETHQRLITIDRMLKIIDEQPAADVQEIRHGRWIKKYLEYKQCLYKCSCCGTEVNKRYIEDFGHKDFCPDCGAKMDKSPIE